MNYGCHSKKILFSIKAPYTINDPVAFGPPSKVITYLIPYRHQPFFLSLKCKTAAVNKKLIDVYMV